MAAQFALRFFIVVMLAFKFAHQVPKSQEGECEGSEAVSMRRIRDLGQDGVGLRLGDVYTRDAPHSSAATRFLVCAV